MCPAPLYRVLWPVIWRTGEQLAAEHDAILGGRSYLHSHSGADDDDTEEDVVAKGNAVLATAVAGLLRLPPVSEQYSSMIQL